MTNLVIFHNPRCSKSRQTLSIIQERGLDLNVVEYLKNPPSKTEIKIILKKLGIRPIDLMRKGETLFKEKNLNDPNVSDEYLIDCMAENPILIERPIVIKGEKAIIGRPPERVMEIL